MVSALMKHEALRTTPMLGACLGIATLVVVLACGLTRLSIPGLPQFAALLAVAVSAGIPVVINIVMAIDFWRTGWGRQGYFTHSIPARGSTILAARILWSVSVVVLSVLCALIAVIFTLWVCGPVFQGDGPSFEMVLTRFLGSMHQIMPWWQWVIAFGLVLFVVWFHLLGFYFPATIGSGPRWASLGSSGPIVVWAITYLLVNLTLVASVALPFGLDYAPGGWRLRIIDATWNFSERNFPAGIILAMVVITVVFLVWMSRSWNRRISLR